MVLQLISVSSNHIKVFNKWSINLLQLFFLKLFPLTKKEDVLHMGETLLDSLQCVILILSLVPGRVIRLANKWMESACLRTVLDHVKKQIGALTLNVFVCVISFIVHDQ